MEPDLEPSHHESADAETAVSSSNNEPKTMLGWLGECRWAQRLTVLTALVVGGGSTLGLTGCSSRPAIEQKEGTPIIFKEAKFSTFAPNASITLADVDELTASRTQVLATAETTRLVLGNASSKADDGPLARDVYDDLVAQAKKAAESLTATAKSDKSFQGAEDHLLKPAELLSALAARPISDFSGHDSPGAVDLRKAHGMISDIHGALEHDLSILEKGANAKSLVGISRTLEQVEAALTPLAGAPDPAWLTQHQNEVTQVRAATGALLAQIEANENRPYFKAVADDLADLKRTLGDVMTMTKDPAAYAEYWTKAADKDASPGVAISRESKQLCEALREDFTKEVTAVLGVQQQAAPAPAGNTQAAPSGHSGHSGGGGFNTFLLWHALSRPGGYSYAPLGSSSYSHSDRLHASPSYGAFSSHSQSSANSASGKSGLASRPSGGFGRGVSGGSAGHGGSSGGHSGGSHGGFGSSGSHGAAS